MIRALVVASTSIHTAVALIYIFKVKSSKDFVLTKSPLIDTVNISMKPDKTSQLSVNGR